MTDRVTVRACPSCGTLKQDSLRYCASCAHDFWAAAAGRSGVPAVSSPSAPASAATPWPMSVMAVMSGGVLIVLGTLLPWISTSSRAGDVAFSGIAGGGDGWITLPVGIGIIALAAFSMRGATEFNRAAVWLLSLIVFAVFWTDLGQVRRAVIGFESEARGLGTADVGIGLWILALGAILAFAMNIARPAARGPGTLPSLFRWRH